MWTLRQCYLSGAQTALTKLGVDQSFARSKAAGFRSGMLLPIIYQGDVAEAKRGREALQRQGGTPGDIQAHDEYIASLELPG